MRLNDNSVGGSLVELILFLPFALLAVAAAAEGSKLFEIRNAVATSMRGALLIPLERTEDASTGVARVAESLRALGDLQLVLVDVTLAVAPESGESLGILQIQSASLGEVNEEPSLLARRALAPLNALRPHPFATPLSLRSTSTPSFRDQLTVRVLLLRLSPNRALTPLLSLLLPPALRIESLQLMPLRGGR